ncbi:unnamed protein product, partial [marine sediment metagenome]
MNIKNNLKKFKLLYKINTEWKAYCVKQRYYSLKKHYEKVSVKRDILYKEKEIKSKVNNFLKKQNKNIIILPKGKLKIFYIGTDLGQDSGGIIQGLKKFGKVIFFEQKPGVYGQMLPTIRKDAADFNGKRLLKMIKNISKSDRIHIIIGQMWGSTMALEALQEIRKMGIPVVNISMDDLHSFKHAFNIKKVNGKLSGTAGLIGSIDLACTAVKECCLWYQVEGCPSIYLPPASDPELYYSSTNPKLYDVCFVGANYGIRTKIINAIEKRGINVMCYGNGWPNGRIKLEKLPQIFMQSRIVL